MENMPLSGSVKKSFKKLLYPDSEADDFQNLTGASLTKETSLSIIFMKFRSVVLARSR